MGVPAPSSFKSSQAARRNGKTATCARQSSVPSGGPWKVHFTTRFFARPSAVKVNLFEDIDKCGLGHPVSTESFDKIADFRIIFPNIYPMDSETSVGFNLKLNTMQKKVVVAITTPILVALSPILLTSLFGTDKSYRDGSGLLQPDSNLADYLHSLIEETMKEAKAPLFYYQKRCALST